MSVITNSDYKIFVGKNVFEDMRKFLKSEKYQNARFFVLADSNTLAKCYPFLSINLDFLEDAEIFEIDSGEDQKNIDIAKELWAALAEHKADRHAVLINLGGGVISDLGGFVASTYKRGISFINVPTSLMAQVDASIGGKVGVNLNDLKNMIGYFKNPDAIFIYPGFLRSLDLKQIISGWAEVIKHALITDQEIWKKIQKTNPKNISNWDSIILQSVNIKSQIVESDFYETSIRKNLNFGHTIGHAIEGLFLENHKHTVLHGEAVAVGMICESYLSFKKGRIKKDDLEKIAAYILKYFPVIQLDEMDYHRIMELITNDKKNMKNKINFSLLNGLGSASVDKSVGNDLIIDSLNYYRKITFQIP